MLQNYSHWIREEAYRLGFEFVGFARAEQMDEEARRLEKWLHAGHHGSMSYMENHFDKRIDPRKLVDNAKTVITLLHNYFPKTVPTDPDAPKIARYAYGQDYHIVLKDKLRTLIDFMRVKVGEVNGRAFTDSAPVLERDWARRSGTGWVGKNTLLIHPKRGSYFFLAELIIDLELVYDTPMKDYCGRCRRCIEACPTEAISKEGYWMDGSKCISYLTIELREAIPDFFKDKMENWMFGCDICQEVCPWNRFSRPHEEPLFDPSPALLNMKKSDWMEITADVFNQLFKKSAVKRTKWAGLKRNIQFLQK